MQLTHSDLTIARRRARLRLAAGLLRSDWLVLGALLAQGHPCRHSTGRTGTGWLAQLEVLAPMEEHWRRACCSIIVAVMNEWMLSSAHP